MASENIPLSYKGHPLRRKDNLIYYGTMAEKYIVMLRILSTKKVDGLEMAEPKTKAFAGFLSAAGVEGKDVVVTEGVKANVVKSARNIPGVVTTPATVLSVYDIVNAKNLVIDKAALAVIEEVYA